MTLNIKSATNIETKSIHRYVPYVNYLDSDTNTAYGFPIFKSGSNTGYTITNITANKMSDDDVTVSFYARKYNSNNFFAIVKDLEIKTKRQEIINSDNPLYLSLEDDSISEIWAISSADNTLNVDIEYKQYTDQLSFPSVNLDAITYSLSQPLLIGSSGSFVISFSTNTLESLVASISVSGAGVLTSLPSTLTFENGHAELTVTGNGTGANHEIDTITVTLPSGVSVDIDAEVLIIPNGQAAYTTSGTFSWTCPTDVYSVCVVCIGGGGGGMTYGGSSATYTYSMNGGGGGALAWCNDIPTTPGETYTVVVGAGGNWGYYSSGSTAGGSSYFMNSSIINAGGGSPGRYCATISGGTYSVTSVYGTSGGGNGGSSITSGCSGYGGAGGGGAGGYTGNGGSGRSYPYNGYNGAGGGGAGGGGADSGSGYPYRGGGGGGGVGIFGEGASGTGGGGGGQGGSGGGDGDAQYSGQHGGLYGGGGGGHASVYYGAAGNGGRGAVRIIWGNGRAFPSTLTNDL